MHKKKGFTLIELLIVVAILAILTLTAIYSIMQNLAKSRDTRRKADVAMIKIALENYYGDKNQYPTSDLLDECDSQELSPYLSSLPCDPKTKQPYCYIYDADAPVGQNYRVLAALENQFDDSITALGCSDDTTFCGYETSCQNLGSGYNYGVSSSDVTVINPGTEIATGGSNPTSTPTSTPSPTPGPQNPPGYVQSCNFSRVCTNYENPYSPPHNCTRYWNIGLNCNNYCDSMPEAELCDD